MPVNQAKSSDAILKVYKLDGENSFSQELYVNEAQDGDPERDNPDSPSSSSPNVFARKAYFRTVPIAYRANSNHCYTSAENSGTTTSTYINGGLKGAWFPASGLMGNIGYAAGYTVPAMGDDAGFSSQNGIGLSGDSACSAYDVDQCCYKCINNGHEYQSWVKYMVFPASVSLSSITMGDKWKWAGGEAPTLGKGVIVACWCHDMGVAAFIPAEAS